MQAGRLPVEADNFAKPEMIRKLSLRESNRKRQNNSMIRINQIKMPPEHTREDIIHKAARILRIPPAKLTTFQIVKKSIDARKKPDIYMVYTVDVTVDDQDKILSSCHAKMGQVQAVSVKAYQFPVSGRARARKRPVIVGTGPAGLFCGYMLARHGYRPLLLERGREAGLRLTDVERFWQEGILDLDSNVQFGEGGAGTFSDGKLNTLVKDPHGRNREVLRIFVEAGAPEEILYEAKPHIGTDILIKVVTNLRRQIIDWGGEVRFLTKVTDLLMADGRVTGVKTEDGGCIESDAVILAIGHSARDTFMMLADRQIPMEAKAFAVGLRLEHPQALIDRIQYGMEKHDNLPAASYKVTAKTASGRGVYSFCMCPGGYVVNASSEPGRTAINGMSYSGRKGTNSNSAMIVTVTPEDYGGTGPLAGIAFQRRLEEQAYRIGAGAVPVERYGAYRQAVLSRCSDAQDTQPVMADSDMDKELRDMSEIAARYPAFTPTIKGRWCMAPVHEILPDHLNASLVEGVDLIGQSVHGFSDPAAFVSGIESRTSSPVRILRDDTGQSALTGLYPCGEGAGYAGGITSAAMDGILIAEKVAAHYQTVIE